MRRGFALSVVLLSGACGPGTGSQPESMQVRDSAGIMIVEHRPAPPSVSEWSISETPDLVIGSAIQDGPELFSGLGDVVELANGTIVVADVGARELRAFDEEGEYLWTAGGSGDGPGEFAATPPMGRLAVLVGDTVLASQGRFVSAFDSSGQFVRRFELRTLSDEFGSAGLFHALPDGRLVVVMSRLMPQEFGRSRGSVALAYSGSDGSLGPIVAELAATERVMIDQGGGFTAQGVANWGRHTEFAAAGGSVVATTQSSFEVLRFNSTGALDLIVRVMQDPLVADAEVRSRLGVRGETVHLPDTLPAVGRLRIDSEQRIWVEEYVPPYESREPSWWVFGHDGVLQARASVPSGFTLFQIRDEYVLGVASDTLGVPYVQVRSILKQ